MKGDLVMSPVTRRDSISKLDLSALLPDSVVSSQWRVQKTPLKHSGVPQLCICAKRLFDGVRGVPRSWATGLILFVLFHHHLPASGRRHGQLK